MSEIDNSDLVFGVYSLFLVFIFTNKPAGISANLLGKQDSANREGYSRRGKFLV